MKVHSRRKGHRPPALIAFDHFESKCSHFFSSMPASPLLECQWCPQAASLTRFKKPSFTLMEWSQCLSETQIPDDWRIRRLVGYLKRSKQPFCWTRC